jgi:uncharacterized protein (DUF1697 family)
MVHLALIRGINVGKKQVKMETLRKVMTEAGFENVSTFIQSGNVIFESAEKSQAKLALAIEGLIQKEFGFPASVVMAHLKRLERTVTENPFLKETSELKQLYVAFLSAAPSQEGIDNLMAAPFAPDLAIVKGDILYLRYLTSAADSKLTTNLIEKKLGVTATARNWNTTLKLNALLKER